MGRGAMKPERWQRIEEIYSSALEPEPEQREAFRILISRDLGIQA